MDQLTLLHLLQVANFALWKFYMVSFNFVFFLTFHIFSKI